MIRTPMSVATALAAGALFAGAVSVLTQGGAGPLGVSDATARKLLADSILVEAFRTYSGDVVRSDLVSAVRRAYDKMPATARGPATTAAFAWARGYVGSPAFAATYAKVRDEQQPESAAQGPSVDEQVKEMMDEQWAVLAQAREMAAALPEKERADLLASIKERETQLKSPDSLKMWRTVVEAERGDKTSRAGTAFAEWEARYPANPSAFVREHLERFLKETANVDYSLAAFMVRGPGGETLGFLSPGYTVMPWQQIHAILAGKEAVDAGRAAAAAWLKELGGK